MYQALCSGRLDNSSRSFYLSTFHLFASVAKGRTGAHPGSLSSRLPRKLSFQHLVVCGILAPLKKFLVWLH